ncbi:MAG: tetratricopeptide repeat protein [Polyangiaceae bacterium]|nr:tetratricopeptide repeat protein [Polyangiaceae bacterium]
MSRGVALAVVIALFGAACGPAWGDAYLDSMAAGQRAYHAGRYTEAETEYQKAVLAARRLKDRDEAMLLVARMQERAGRLEEARVSYEAIAVAKPPGPRKVRAAVAAAQILIEQGRDNEGYARLLDIAKKDPNHGDARTAMLRVIENERDLGGDERVLAFLIREQPIFRGTELAIFFDYHIAKGFADTGKVEKARDLFVAHARANPYPYGEFTDDAFMRAADIEVELGHPKEAIKLIDEMLSVLEVSGIPGSYTRPRFPEGAWKRAEIYRDKLNDNASARRAFHWFYKNLKFAIKRDDALWEEALLASKDGDASNACHLVETLADDFPQSRYVRCGHELCKTADLPKQERECPEYILRGIRQMRGEPEPE